jgi:DNA-binding XRE family transcriptional regulator
LLIRLQSKAINKSTAEIKFVMPLSKLRLMAYAFETFLELDGHKVRRLNAEGDELIPADEVFPDTQPGDMVKGLRGREGIPQKQMAEKLGLKQHHISEMEKGIRPITLEMAKRIGKTFNISYKVFL